MWLITKEEKEKDMLEKRAGYGLRDGAFILLGAILLFLPFIYWNLTVGQRPMYEVLYAETVFFPDYFVMLLLAVFAAGLNCLLSRKWLTKKHGLLWMLLFHALLWVMFMAVLAVYFGISAGVWAAAAFVMVMMRIVLLCLLATGMVQGCVAVLFSAAVHMLSLLYPQ